MIGKGTRIRLRNVYGGFITGTVDSASNQGTDANPNWYIELTADEYGAIYWKQAIDGGSVEIIAQPPEEDDDDTPTMAEIEKARFDAIDFAKVYLTQMDWDPITACALVSRRYGFGEKTATAIVAEAAADAKRAARYTQKLEQGTFDFGAADLPLFSGTAVR
jgi:hypothetical protein